MKNKLSKLLYLFCIYSLLGCESFLEVNTPNNQLLTPDVYKTDETAISAMTGCYAKLLNAQFTVPYNLSLNLGYYSDELRNYSSSLSAVDFYTNNLNAVSSLSNNYWNTFYNIIYQTNAVYEGCNESLNISPKVKVQLMAEARFLRAFLHLYLTNLYGEIPVVTTTNYDLNSKIYRSSLTDVNNQIIADLQYACENLSANYLSKNSTTVSVDRVRPNQAAAHALLSRAFLYAGDFINAEKEANIVIQNNSYILSTVPSVFLRNSKEVIWQLQMTTPTAATLNTWEGYKYILTAKPLTTSDANISTISPQLLSAFEIGDQRRNSWIGSFTDASGTYYFSHKFKIQSSQTATEWTIPLRLAEQYLIRSEARAQQNKIDLAKQDLNVIRQRASLAPNNASDKESLLNAILQERRVEFFTEWGHRWFDLKRFGKVNEVMSVISPLKGGTWSSYKLLWPIPNADIQNNKNLLQNPGYN